MFSKVDLSTECFPCLDIGRYCGACAVFDDCDIEDEKGLDEMTVKIAQSECLDRLSDDMKPHVKSMKATGIGDVWDHNYGDTWLNFDVEADLDAIEAEVKADARYNFKWYSDHCPIRISWWEFTDALCTKESGHWAYRWQAPLLWFYAAIKGIDIKKYQDKFIAVFYDEYVNYVKFEED